MDIRRIFAILLAAVVAASMLCACGDKSADQPLVSGDSSAEQEAPTDNTEVAAVEPGLFIDGEEVDVEGLDIMTINGIGVPFDEYRYMYIYLDNYYFSGGDSSFWPQNADLFPTLLEYVEQYLLESYWGYLLAAQYGIELTEEDLDEIETHMQEEKAEFASEEEFENALKSSGITEDLLRRLIAEQIICNRAYEELYGKEGAQLLPSDDEIKDILENDYRRVYHVLVTFDHFSGAEGYEDADEDELKAAALEYAEQLRDEIEGGADIYQLAQSADDPGMVDNPDGYFFTYNTMVKPFEDSAFSLEVGELSDIVETDYGYHIILRLEQDDYVNDNWDSVREACINAIFNDNVNEMLANADVEYCEYFDRLSYDSIK